MNNEYQAYIQGAVWAGLLKGPTSFGELLQVLPGIWPGTVVDCLNRLAAEKCTVGIAAGLLATDATSEKRLVRPQGDEFSSLLPVEHPLDFEWRFDSVGIERLWQEYDDNSSGFADVILLGVPSLLWSAYLRGLASRCLLFDSNSAVVSWFLRRGLQNVVRCSIGAKQEMPGTNASFVVIDPPWYFDHYISFLWSARSYSRLGGKVVVSLPPLGTRPGIQKERQDLFAIVTELGLEVESLSAEALPYQTPFFEANALVRAGITGAPHNWRKGDLLVLRVVGSNRMPHPSLPYLDSWTEVSVAGTRWRVGKGARFIPFPQARCVTSKGGDRLILDHVVAEDVLPTVSARDIRRSHANVWTSGNRIFNTDQPERLVRILRSLAADEIEQETSPEHSAKGLNGNVADSVDRRMVKDICEIELREMQGMGYLPPDARVSLG